MRTGLWRGTPKEIYSLVDLGVGWSSLLKWMLKKQFSSVWTGLIWLTIETVVDLFASQKDSAPWGRLGK